MNVSLTFTIATLSNTLNVLILEEASNASAIEATGLVVSVYRGGQKYSDNSRPKSCPNISCSNIHNPPVFKQFRIAL